MHEESTILVLILLISPGVSDPEWKVTLTPNKCVPLNSSVDIGCSYKYLQGYTPVHTYWIVNDTEPWKNFSNVDKIDRLEYLGDKEKNCTLRITDVRDSDTGAYKFRFETDKSNGKWTSKSAFTLSVTALQVETVTEGQSVTLTCRSSCPPNTNPTYIWYKNRQPVTIQPRSNTLTLSSVMRSTDSGSYSCAVQGHENDQSPAKTLVVQYPPKKTSASISPAGDIVEGDSVTLTCSSDANPPVHTYTWYKTTQGENAIGSGQTYNFNKISSEHTGQYYCTGRNTIGFRKSLPLNVTVYYSPKNTLVSVKPTAITTEGDSVTLTCISDANPPVMTYTWYKVNKGGTPVGSGQTHTIVQITTEDTGQYYCRVNNSVGFNNSTMVSIDVFYSPKNTLASISPPGDIVEGDSVTLTCSSDANPPVDTYTWYKTTKGGNELGSGQTYNFNNISSEHTGQYYCRGTNRIGYSDSLPLNLTVFYSPKRTSASIVPSGNVKEGDSVTLTCSSDANPPVDTYTWYKTTSSESAVGSGQNYEIPNITTNDTGHYYCRAENTVGYSNSTLLYVNVFYPPKNTLVLISPTGSIKEGDSVTLTCSSDANPPVHNYTWYKTTKGGTAIGSGQNYEITNITTEDTGHYYCKVENSVGFNNSTFLFIDVLYTPKNTSVSISPSGDIVEGDSVTLTCSSDANPPVHTYTWYKINRMESISSGKEYIITKTRQDDSGQYYCRAENTVGYSNSTLLHVNVFYPPKNTLVLISPTGSIKEGDSVTLTCSSDANPPVHTYTWYKTNNGGTAIGSGQNYDIPNITTEDTGHYYCRVENSVGLNDSTELPIDVFYPPKNTSLVLSPPSKSSEDSVTLACNSDANPPIHTYTWFKKTDSGPALQATGNTSSLVLVSGDEGFYYCVAHNQYGSHYSPVFQVTFPVPAGLYAAVGVLLPVALTVVIVLVFVYKRRKQPSTDDTNRTGNVVQPNQGDSSPIYDDVGTALVTSGPKSKMESGAENDIQYASVHFKAKKKEDSGPIYDDVATLTVTSDPENKMEAGAEDEVQYASVQFKAKKKAGSNDKDDHKQKMEAGAEEDIQYASVHFKAKKKP
ncbi:B-cell receptor CD22 [Engraulis encrasicolus]|uniref:B-cell receptor CD22 n=1 Tax=Engraulis encrasicolus TaxID=184585 RepID=UPI002FD24FE9